MAGPQLFVVEEYVEVLAIDNEEATETTMISAPKESRILNAFVGPQMLAYFVTSRFADHQPYYRLEETLLRSGIPIDRGTLCPWMVRLSFRLLPLVDRMRPLALESSVAQAAETSVKLLVPGQGQASSAYLWAVLGESGHPYTTFYFTEDRSGPARISSSPTFKVCSYRMLISAMNSPAPIPRGESLWRAVMRRPASLGRETPPIQFSKKLAPLGVKEFARRR